MSGHNIIWSPVAKSSYYQILEYLLDEWTIKECNAFIKRTEEVIGHIPKNPLLFQHSLIGDAHKCVVVKQVSLFYRIKGHNIELLVFWDNRKHPGKLML